MKKFLLWLIRIYHRKLRFTKFFSQKICTFGHTESCSCYAKRMLLESNSILTALLRVKRRLELCSNSSLYLDENKVLWGQLYEKESYHRVLMDLHKNQEKNETIFIVLKQFFEVKKLKNEKNNFLRNKISELQSLIKDIPQLRVRKVDILLFLKNKLKKKILFSAIFTACLFPILILNPIFSFALLPLLLGIIKLIKNLGYFKKLFVFRNFNVPLSKTVN